MISEEMLLKFKEELLSCHRPLFLFDDDPDGLASFLLLYRFVQKGTGWPLKSSYVSGKLSEKVNNYSPDLIIVLDKPNIEDDFLADVSTKIIWLDHHKPSEKKVHLYLNPQVMTEGDNSCTSYWAYQMVKQDLWIMAVGMFSDWQTLPEDYYSEFVKKYPTLSSSNDVETALYKDEIGKLSRIFSFNLKGQNKDILSSVKILSRIENPLQILKGETAQGRLLLKRFEKHNISYQKLLSQVNVTDDKLLLFHYDTNENSYTADLSNELLVKHPDKIIIIARQSGDSYKCSLRSAKLTISDKLERVLNQTAGVGGGHVHACGAVIPDESFETFIQLFREELH